MRTLSQLRSDEKRLILEAVFYVGVARIVSKAVPFRYIARVLQTPIRGSEPELEDLRTSKRIGWAVAAVSRTKTLHAVCLGQAIAAQLMLKRRKIPSTLHLGVAYEGPKMIAHAWVTVGDYIVTGAGGHERYAVVSKLSSA